MAIPDHGTDVKDRKEPVPRDFLRFFPDSLQRTVLNWFGGQDRMLGEIVSGVNRNRQNIVQLETDYQASDGALSTAYIAADAVVAADAESANASLQTTLETAISDGDTTTLASANSYTDTEVSAEGAARATAIDTLQAATLNPGLNLFPHPSGYGQGYATSTAGLGWIVSGGQVGNGWNQITSANSKYAGDGYYEYWAASHSSTNRAYLYQIDDGILAGQSYTLSFTGFAGVVTGQFYIAAYNASSSYLGNSSVVNMTSTLSRQSVSYTLPTGTSFVRLVWRVASGSYSSGGEMFVKQIKFEIGSSATSFSEANGVGRLLTASVNTMREAFVDAATGEAYATMQAEAAAGSFSAMLRMYAGDGSSSIGLFAEQLYLGNNTIFEDTYNTFYNTYSSYRLRWGGPFGSSGNLVFWRGPTSVALNSETTSNGTFALDTSGGTHDDVTSSDGSSTDGSITLTAHTWVTVESVTVTTTGGPVLLVYNAVPYVTTTTSISPIVQARLLRGATTIRNAHTTHFPSTNSDGSQQAGGAYSGSEIDEPSAGTYTYYLQLKGTTASGSGTLFSSTAEFRSIYATEYKR